MSVEEKTTPSAPAGGTLRSHPRLGGYAGEAPMDRRKLNQAQLGRLKYSQ